MPGSNILDSGTPLSQLDISPDQRQAISQEVSDAFNRGYSELIARKAELEEVRDALANKLGVGDDTVNGIYDNPLTEDPADVPEPSEDELATLAALDDLIQITSDLALMAVKRARAKTDAFALANQYLPSDSKVSRPEMILPVPFPHGGSLERLAQQYLGDAKRWFEIAVLNNLKAPYIDEDGFELAFTTSGLNTSFQVDYHADLYVGQKVMIYSDSLRENERTIVALKLTVSGSYLVTVDGEELSAYTVAANSTLHAWKAGTVRSSNVIYVPSSRQADVSNITVRDTAVNAALSRSEKVMGVDFLLTEDMDLSIAPNGLANLATGYTNALQALKLKLSIEKGELAHHPEYGVGINPGEASKNMTAGEINERLQETILSDDRFQTINNITIDFDGPKVNLNIEVQPKSGGALVPVSFVL